MTASVIVRHAEFGDLGAIIAFNQSMAHETEAKALPHGVISAGVKNLFHNPHYGFYLVAVADGQIVGCLLITFEWSDWRNGLIWWIQSVYVRGDWRRQGVYRRLYRHVKTLAQQDPTVRGFRLYVEKNNRIAQRTYSALGMAESDYKLFEEMLETANFQ